MAKLNTQSLSAQLQSSLKCFSAETQIEILDKWIQQLTNLRNELITGQIKPTDEYDMECERIQLIHDEGC